MTKKSWIAVAVAAAIIGVAVVVFFVFRNPMSEEGREKIQALLHPHKKITLSHGTESIQSNDLLQKYYDIFGYTPLWSDKAVQNVFYRTMLIQMLNHADSLGLDRNDYHNDYVLWYDSVSHLKGFAPGQFESENEIIFTDAALSFLYNVAYGKEIERIEYNGVKYNIDSGRIVRVFKELLSHHDWRRTLDSIEPQTSQYRFLKSELNRMTAILRQNPFLDSAAVANTSSGKFITILKLKAYKLIPDLINADSVDEETLHTALLDFQRMMSIDTTGKLDSRTQAALSFPLKQRIEQIKESLNCWRWTGRLAEKEFILVNIPAARLQIVGNDTLKDMSMRVIVGKEETKTPSFTAYVTRVITYPYWTVPVSIATKEMLPKIQKRVGYLDDNAIQVINSKGEVVDPQTIAWKKLTPEHLPYTFRQATGCDNSLGVLKFDLNSPFSIYLHDTNHRELFSNKNRYISHGCVRVEKPMELAHYLLEGLDSATVALLNNCVHDQKPKEFPLKKKIPVLIFYMTADVDENGHLKFYNDVYKLEKEIS
jgi:murein L,D-transpeptidase YcbB/YkuD